ncbi:Probable thiosulfate sulfurtransferase (CysA) [Mycobacteroides abscessus]|nr:Probable thiosulfate sulfurtransferase (CysA) [Mycobacteroides abscessus]
MARSDVLVSAQWAQDNLSAPNTVFVEVDEDTSAYDVGHIEGAVKLDWKTDLQDAVKRDFVDQQQFSKLLSDKGISNDDTVVLYGGNNNWFAAYAYWYFKLYGHQDVKLLDGGRKKWELDGRPLSTDTVSRPATSYQAAAPDNTIRAFRDEVIAAIGTKNLVDVRSPDEFSGKILAPAPCRRSRASARGTSPAPSTFPGARPPPRTAPSSRMKSWPSSTPTPGWTARRKPSRTAASVSAPRTPGLCCRRSWGTRT